MATCDTCGKLTDDVHRHHVLPRKLGGTDAASNIVSICVDCHRLLHGNNGLFRHTDLIRRGLSKARDAGQRLGPPLKVTPTLAARIAELHAAGATQKAIASQCGLSVGTVNGFMQRELRIRQRFFKKYLRPPAP